ncbi:tRNA (adenosine(37)-N6)-dimethylallyltransferase MiaA [Gymnodinialimonas ceratoperidinii]|uniref:tRNA dimethylallyltransferase n=1 Tax=Gymnodinialimonas ceratoperidinii TaxID=2856823 RepID=A0A8F6TTL8_9RHOB|nr:tRNA (adenosine(37)-N6)-dimethylallyltransferase MiaA [Gymnodinialimonas ceratoperidinii]QXT38480.1 tRNA (adenosine(37)-N6)-dimethylallyltransferase MiaA [Gymnodinialimonas ceratoperidinii]
MIDISTIAPDKPVLIAGPTASGKTALAISIAQAQDRVIVNADALQVYDGWRILTARPSATEEAAAPHHLFGHVPFTAHYDVGQWLRDVTPFLAWNPVIVGGTGLYFRALTQGLADIPAVPRDIRAEADALPFDQLLNELSTQDPTLTARIDCNNRMRVQRGWEVLRATGRPLSDWQDETAPPLLPLHATSALALMPDRDWLNDRIARRFDQMIAGGALDEAKANLPRWPDAGGAAKAIGAPELIAHLQGSLTLKAAREAAVIATRQYAKRQRSWLRSNTKGWTQITLP